jgi:hypothetical protein
MGPGADEFEPTLPTPPADCLNLFVSDQIEIPISLLHCYSSSDYLA